MTHAPNAEPNFEPDPELLDADGWPEMPGTPAERDAAFVRALLEAQLALARDAK